MNGYLTQLQLFECGTVGEQKWNWFLKISIQRFWRVLISILWLSSSSEVGSHSNKICSDWMAIIYSFESFLNFACLLCHLFAQIQNKLKNDLYYLWAAALKSLFFNNNKLRYWVQAHVVLDDDVGVMNVCVYVWVYNGCVRGCVNWHLHSVARLLAPRVAATNLQWVPGNAWITNYWNDLIEQQHINQTKQFK